MPETIIPPGEPKPDSVEAYDAIQNALVVLSEVFLVEKQADDENVFTTTGLNSPQQNP